MMTHYAAQQGYDTIQFIFHPDPTWMCNRRTPKGVMNIEIISAKINGNGACGSDLAAFRAGLDADQPCECDNSQPWLTCEGYGSEARFRHPRCKTC